MLCTSTCYGWEQKLIPSRSQDGRRPFHSCPLSGIRAICWHSHFTASSALSMLLLVQRGLSAYPWNVQILSLHYTRQFCQFLEICESYKNLDWKLSTYFLEFNPYTRKRVKGKYLLFGPHSCCFHSESKNQNYSICFLNIRIFGITNTSNAFSLFILFFLTNTFYNYIRTWFIGWKRLSK